MRTNKEERQLIPCSWIRPGMVFDFKGQWIVIEEGSYMLKRGKRVPIENTAKNKWWCKKRRGKQKPWLICFDLIFDNKKRYHFR